MRISIVISIIIPLALGWNSTYAQLNDISVSPLWSLNSEADEIFCTFYEEKIILSSNASDIIIDDHHRYKNNFILHEGFETTQAYQYEIETEFLSKRVFEDVGTASYDPISQVMYFSTAYNYNGEKGETLKIYSVKKTKRGWSRPKNFKFNNEFYSVAHPWINEDGSQLFFSSNMEGGKGGMDIWFCNLIDGKKWSDPIWAGEALNTSANELFPTVHNGDIYFSSDRDPKNGLDIYRAFKVEQWEKTERLRAPLNSEGDDFQMVYRDGNSGFLTSSRSTGQGGDDIYFFRIKTPPKITDSLSFLLQFKDTPMQGAQILFTDEDDVVLKDLITDGHGKVPIGDLDLKSLKKIYVLDIDNKVMEKAILYLIDQDGNKLRSFRFGEDGFFKFEYLPLDMLGELPKLDETDHSFLTLNLEGQVYSDKPGDLGKGEVVYITNAEGDILALSYTSDEGRFDVAELEPLQSYLFRFENDSGIRQLKIRDRNTNHTIDVTQNKAFYKRIDIDNSLRIIDEQKQPIYVNQDEVFIIKNFYYEFESVDLNEVAKEQLSDLALIMRNNPTIKIELASHTDCRGTNSFNLNLSNLRAQNAVNYLVSQGISKSRLTSVGYGEFQLINHCTDLVECSEEEHALNRRTEVKIYED